MPGQPDDLVRTVSATPDEVLRRIEGSLVAVDHLWFTTPASLRAWDRATSALYRRSLADGVLEVGPRLANLQAARLCPVVRVRVSEHPEGARVAVSTPHLPRFATGLLGVVAVLCAGWGGVILSAWWTDGDAVRGLVFWLGLLATIPAVLGLAWGPGRRALEAGLPTLWAAAEDPDAGADDW